MGSSQGEVELNKHGVPFARATEVFRDPLALTIPDEEPSEAEIRWITMGKDMGGQYILVVHTFEEVAGVLARVRLISARPPRAEVHAYEEEL